MPELTLESLAARLAEVERQLAARPVPPWQRPLPPRTPEDDAFAQQMVAQMQATRDAQRRVAELTNVPELADNPGWEGFLQAMRENREQMAREDAERWAAEDAAARQAGE